MKRSNGDQAARTRRRISRPVVLGVLVLVGGAVGVVGVQRLTGHEEALALARPVEVGQLLVEQDLVEVNLSASDVVDLVPASDAPSLLGRPAAYRLPVGILLTRSAVGHPQVPAAGRAVVALALKPGQYPPGLSAGTSVIVLIRPTDSERESDFWPAVVAAVEDRRETAAAVVSFDLSQVDAREVAAKQADRVAVVMTSGGR
ncbi:hypothetical protein JNUCC0626_13895 [Lentzea sp. JNUCC 0626]|uniref:hypothetical protein n=1 Tax=Lentzea sp. JNUCC 0626 TaxID=3367513 RepID=UPI003749B4A5